MIYLDTSVALAHLLAEDRHPPPEIWDETLVAGRLLEYEIWTRIHARGLENSHADVVRQLIGRVAILEIIPEVLTRAYHGFPAPVRTLDALHLASLYFIREQGQDIALASYDVRMLRVARALGFDIFPLD